MRWWSRLAGGFTALVQRPRIDAELGEELQGFFAASVQAKVDAGMSRADAERAARTELGSVPAVKDWVRDVGWESRLESVWQDVRYAFRVLRRSPGFAVTAIGTLAVGLGTTAAMYAVVDAVLVRPFNFEAPDRVFELNFKAERSGTYGVGAGAIDAVRALPEVEYAAGTVTTERAIVGAGVALLATGDGATEDFFQIFGVRAALGRTFSRADVKAGPVVVLSDELWRRAFGARADIVGQAIGMNGVPHHVLGVMPRGFRFRPALPTDFWVLRPVPGAESTDRGTGAYQAFAKTRTPRLDVVRAQAAGLDVARTRDGERIALVFVPMLDAVAAFYGRTLWSLLGAVAFVLLLACGNVANLLLARVRQRTPELMIRGAIGAGRGRLTRQMLTECGVIAALAALAGCGVAALLVEALPLLPVTPVNVSRIDEVSMDGRVYVFMTLIAFATVWLIGVVPAVSVARRLPLIGSPRTVSVRHGRAPQALIAVEIAATVAMLTGGALIALRVFDLMNTDVGFDLRGLQAATVRPLGTDYDAGRLGTFYASVTEHLRQSSGLDVAVVDIVPLDFRRPAPTRVTSQDGPPVSAGVRVMSAGAIRLIGAEVRAGRDFTMVDRAGAPAVALVNESFASRLNTAGRSPLGTTLTLERDGGRHVVSVVGIVNDVRQNIYRRPDAEVYLSAAQFPPRRASLVVRSSGPRESVDLALREAVRIADPRQALSEVVAVTDRVRTFTAFSRFVAVLMTLFAVVAVLLAATGVLAVCTAAVAARTREIGIRVAIGATRGNILACVSRDFLPGVVAGAVAGVGGAASLASVIRWLEPGVAASNPVPYVCALIGIFGVAVAGAWLPARRALAIEPTVALTSVEEW